MDATSSQTKEETIMELVIIVAGIILAIKFSSSLNAIAVLLRAKSEIVAEKVIGECVEERTDNFEEFQRRMDGKKIYTNEEIMATFRVRD
jgi:hypothetical protein